MKLKYITMKKVILFFFVYLISFSLIAQVSTTDKLIPSLQYDNDFMEYIEFTMKDGMIPIKQVKGKMKFVQGQKVYSIEINKFKSNKKLVSKLTYFYHENTPIAISEEKKEIVKVYYLKEGQIIASKKFKANIYIPYGGKEKLDLSTISLDKNPRNIKKKYLEQSTILLKRLKEASKNILEYRF